MEQKYTNNIKDIIESKILETARKEGRIRKKFVFSPSGFYMERVNREIEKYLIENSDKIEDFDLEYRIDSETFDHVIELNILPIKSIRKSMTPHLALIGLLSEDNASLVLREKIQKMLMEYEWEFNSPETRKMISRDLSSILGVTSIVDKTSPEDVDSSIMKLFVLEDDGNEVSINEYVKKIAKRWKKE